MRELRIGRPVHVLVVGFLFVQIRGDKILETFSREENDSINLPNQEVPGRLSFKPQLPCLCLQRE